MILRRKYKMNLVSLFSGAGGLDLGFEKAGFNVVVANINRNILLNDMPMFKKVMSANGILILSGFYAADIPLLEEKATSLGLSLIEVKNKDEWRACIFRLKNQ